MSAVRENRLDTLSPYQQGKSGIDGQDTIIKLSSNESPHGPSPQSILAFQKASETFFRYPDGGQTDLRNAIGSTHDLPIDQIICGNGSDELISLIMRATLQPGDEVVISENSFVMAKIHAIAQGAKVKIAYEPDMRPDADAMLAQITDKTRIVVFASPNNPVGLYVSKKEMARLIAQVPKNILVIIDSAYGDYVEAEDYDAGTDFVTENENVVMTRTFSKMYGLAGLRIGWMYGPKTLVGNIQKIRTPFNANSAAMAAATAAVLDGEYTKYVRDYNNKWLKYLIAEIEKLGLIVPHSVANFYLILFPENGNIDATKAETFLLSKGIIPRTTAAGGPQNALRITVGLESENIAVLNALKELMSET